MKRINLVVSILTLIPFVCFGDFDNFGMAPSGNVRDNPFRPLAPAPIATQAAVEGVTKTFKDIIPSLLSPSGVKVVNGEVSILIGDMFYSAGDVLHVEVTKDASLYDITADDVKIAKITPGEFYIQLRSEQHEGKREMVIPLPRPDELEDTPSSVVTDIGSVTFLRHEEEVVDTKK